MWVIAAVVLVGGVGSLAGQASRGAAPAASSSATTRATADPSAEASRKADKESRAAAEAAAQASRSASAEAAAAEASASAAAEASAAAQASASAAAEASAAAQASATAQAALTDVSTYSKISSRDWQLIEKDPDSHVGEKYIVYGRVTQADAATGTEMFRVDTGGTKADWYDYDINTVVAADPSIVTTIVTDDLVKMYITVTGAYSYDTQIGGSTTAVAVLAGVVENLGSTND